LKTTEYKIPGAGSSETREREGTAPKAGDVKRMRRKWRVFDTDEWYKLRGGGTKREEERKRQKKK
jgi:hypothetical protein